MLAFAFVNVTSADAQTRKLKLHFLHTGEKAEITFKKNGRYVSSGLQKINRFLRDWRRNEPTKMDPKLIDLIWEVYQETGSRDYVTVISGYRSPATNKLLRKRGRGVAKKSQHTLGKALDFFIPGVSLRKLRDIGLKKGLGGVGYYPKSGSPFVHMDTGRVRHWPRMSRKELVKVFPRGKTLHVPTDGKPLPKYNLAKAEYERKIKGTYSVASARDIKKRPSVFAKWFDRSEGSDEEVAAKPTRRPNVATLHRERPSDRVPSNASSKGAGQAKPTAKPELEKPEVPVVNTTPAPVPAAPVPSVGIPEQSTPAPDTNVTPESEGQELSPELVIAGLSGNAIPVPQFSPLTAQRLQTGEPVPAIAEEAVTVQVAEAPANEVGTAEEALQLAYALPVSAPRNELVNPLVETGNISITPDTPVSAAQSVEQAQDQAKANIQVAALSADEIQDLRQSVYKELASEAAQRRSGTGDTTSRLALAPSQNKTDNKAQTAIWNQLEQQDAPAVDENSSVASITQAVDVASIPLPLPAPRKSAPAAIKQQPAIAAVKRDSGAKASSVKDGEVVDIDEYRLGNWALQPSVTLEEIKNIKSLNPGRSQTLDRAQSILSRGFVVDTAAGKNGFGSKALGPLDFNRLQ